MEIRQSLENNFLTCRICNKHFNEPKVLICMHTFCKACLEHILEQETLDAAKKRREIEQQNQARTSGYSSSSSSMSTYKGRWSKAFKHNDSYDTTNAYTKNRFSEDTIQCPVCEKKTTLPMSGVHGLQDDQLAGKLASIVGRIPNYPVCDVCSNGQGGMYTENMTTNEVSKRTMKSHPWTDAEDIDSTSDFQSTEDEDDNSRRHKKQTFGFRSKILRNGGRRYQKNLKSKLVNASDDELIHPSFECQKSSMLEPNQATVACLECSKQLCTYCHRNHTKLSITADHIIVSLDQLASLSCPRHPREMKRFFCVTCGELICLVCTFESNISDLNSEGSSEESSTTAGHSDHNVLSIRQGLTSLEQSINKSTFDCKQKAERLDLLLLGIRSCDQSVSNIKMDINNAAEELIEQINSQRLKLLKELDSDVGVNREEFIAQSETISSSLASWEEMKKEGDCIEEIFSMHPVEALTEASLIRNRFLGCLEVLSSSISRMVGWSKLIKEIDSLEHNFSEATILNHEDQEDEVGEEIIDEATKITKRVRFAPPAEAAGLIPSSHSVHWTRRLGKFIPERGAKLGRRVTPAQLATEAFERENSQLSKAVQVSPTDVYGKLLPVEKDARRHRAIQVNPMQANNEDVAIQTEPLVLLAATPLIKVAKTDNGTQYQSSDVNIPLSFFRSSRQIMVQK